MKNTLRPLLAGCFALLSVAVLAQSKGKVIEEAVVKGKILSHPVRYTVYLPADYNSSERTYPVVYLLHGLSDDNTGWLQYGEINRLADKAIEDGTIPPMIIVMPDADSTFYINSYDGKEKFEDFFVKEFIPTIEKTYRIKAERRYRGVAGLSMGGYGALVYGLKHPELFSATAGLSAAVFEDASISGMPDNFYQGVFGPIFGRDAKGEARVGEHFQQNSILKIVNTKPVEELKKVRYWIDCGDDDFLTKGNAILHMALTDRQVPHEFRMRDGAHTWDYWRTGIIPALQFIGQSFHQ
ncbi:MAG: esterase family protein [Chitinophagaceae bacterium]|nr:MAG: esterase family protein [Chitinophagaceae bacterium]